MTLRLEGSAEIGERLEVLTGTGGAGPGDPLGLRWDVALSFAGALRDFVGQVAVALRARVRCFYGAGEQIELRGKYLAGELPAIYGKQAAAVVIFVSAGYTARDWTRHDPRHGGRLIGVPVYHLAA